MTEPTDAELGKLAEECGIGWGAGLGGMSDFLSAFARAVLAKWGPQPQAGAVPLTGEYPALVCDYCGALTPDPWHSSGMLHGKMSKHIHSCDACAARGVAKAQDTPAYSPAQSDL